MALTTLDPKTALIVIDLQKGIVGLPCTHPIGEVVERARSLAIVPAAAVTIWYGEAGTAKLLIFSTAHGGGA